MIQNKTRKLVVAALMTAIGFVLPFVTMQVPSIGNMLLPMHIPVILCGFLCGAPYGLAVGFLVPLLRSLILGMPPLMPQAATMAFELAAYGLFSGLLYQKLRGKKGGIYLSLIGAMMLGRVVYGIAAFVVYSILGTPFTFPMFLMAAFANAVPGIVIQLVLIPILIYRVSKMSETQEFEDGRLIMEEKCAKRFEPAVAAIERLLKDSKKEILLVGIDGRCAGGKTTLGYYLRKKYDCNLFHMDDFFLQENQKTEERLSEVGGNVDYERFKAEVLDVAAAGKTVSYRPYSCKEKKIQTETAVKKRRLNIVEGSYSLHPYFKDSYDLRIFVDIDRESQKERVLKRNGEEQWKRFESEWIPKEESYIQKFSVTEGTIYIQ